MQNNSAEVEKLDLSTIESGFEAIEGVDSSLIEKVAEAIRRGLRAKSGVIQREFIIKLPVAREILRVINARL